MPIRTALAAYVLVLGTLATVTSASAGDPYGGFGPNSDTATQAIGSEPDNSAPAPDDQQTLPWLQQQSQDQQDSYGNAGEQQGSADNGYDMDDEGGH